MRDKANNVSRDCNMKGLISLGREVGLYPKNKEKPLSISNFKKENDVIESLF